MIKETEYLTSKNRTYTYILPALGNTSHEFKNLVQCFVGDHEFPEEKGKVFLLYKISREPWFNDYFKYITGHEYFERYYKIHDEYLMVVYDLKGDDLERYKNFVKGKYSKLDEDYKKKILNFHHLDYHSEVAKVLWRKEDKYREWEKRLGMKISRTQEIGNMPDLEYEVFQKERMFIEDKEVID